ncbi:sensor histidine kinase [Streptomyces sp. NPDC058471]|uniref:sensor histidine kinase n=1 Tax=Streptomyces sp. NPDC058471 TaxID=3346516 RepID=UPI00365298DA
MSTIEDPIARAIAHTLLPRRAAVPHTAARDVAVVASLLLLQTLLAVLPATQNGRAPDVWGWALLTAMPLVLLLRRRAVWFAAVTVLVLNAPYHLLDYTHTAALPVGVVVLFHLAVAGPPIRSLLTLGGTLLLMTAAALAVGQAQAVPGMFRDAGWLVAVAVIGEALRVHRRYVDALIDRAEHAEHTREEEAARRVAEERLRVARDLHDLLAQSITLIGVQTSVAAHLLVEDPGRLDRASVAEALEGIAETCRSARGELRTTLVTLRKGDSDSPGPAGGPAGTAATDPQDGRRLPHIAGLTDLVRTARTTGAHVVLDVREAAARQGHDSPERPVPTAVGAATYRIVQEALTNAVRHAGHGVHVWVTVEHTADGEALRVVVLNNSGPKVPERTTGGVTGAAAGFGLTGMRERARSVGGTLTAAPSSDGSGFAVRARLPLDAPGPKDPESAEGPGVRG